MNTEETKTEERTLSDQPAVYVGTYHKYNCGSIAGAWLYPEDYTDKDAFYVACRELHKDEEDPELMFQDHQMCAEYVTESSIADELWEYLALDDSEREIVQAYRSNCGESDIQTALDAYHGTFSSLADYVESHWEECGDFKRPDGAGWWHPSNYTDWERMGKDLERSGDIFTVACSDGVMIFANI